MRTKEQFLMLWMLGGMMLAGLAACSGDDDTATDGSAPQTADDGVKVRHITITETEEEAARQIMTRASLAEGDGILTALWTADDGLTYCNLSRVDRGNSDAPYSGLLIANSTAATSQFTGDVYCLAGDYLAVVYPATTFETNDSYTISLTGQNGTLSKLATNYHYVFGKATVTEVTETTANATLGKMKSLLTVCKFSFKDKSTNAVIPIQTLSISYGGTGSDALEVIKNNLERNVEEKQRAQFIRLLAIDTDKNTQFKNGTTKKVGTASVRPIKRFEDSEFFWLNNAPAQSAKPQRCTLRYAPPRPAM